MKKIILLLFTLNCFSQIGALDTTFGVNGNISTPVFASEFINRLSVRLTNGQYILYGQIYAGVPDQLLRFSRFNADGSLDLSFGVNGYLEPTIRISAMQMQTNGKFVAVGVTNTCPTIARYNPDGTLDTSFGTNGTVVFSGLQGYGFGCMSIAPDQSIIAGFKTNAVANNSTFILCKVVSNGSIDTSFGTNGVMVASPLFSDGANRQEIYNLNIQQDGKIVVSGSFNHINASGGGSQQNFLARFLTNGSLDTTYGTNGFYIAPYYSYYLLQTIQPDDKILIAKVAADGQIQLFRYLPNGGLDTSFGTNGSTLTTISPCNQVNNGISNILLQPDGKIVLVGSVCSPAKFLIVRYTSGGLIDTGFNTVGYNLVQRGNNDCNPYFAVHLQDDGKLVAIGYDTLHFQTNVMTVFSRFISGLLETEGFVKSEVAVYPNPSSGIVHLSLKEDMSYTLYTITGTMISKGNVTVQNNTLDISLLSTGVYMLQLQASDGAVRMVKVLKE